MATLISAATGDFTNSATWKTISTASGADLDTDANVINISTGNSDSGTFILAATNVDAVAIKLSTITNPTGTLTVHLRNSTAASNVKTVVINGSDLPTSPTGTGNAGWYVFSFSAHTPNGTDTYLIRITRSVVDSAGNRIALTCSTAAAANMARMVRLVTTAAPGVNDKLMIAGEFTGQAASTPYEVTMDNIDSTSFGPTVSGGPPQGMTINNKGTLTFGTADSTNYYLKVKGIIGVYAEGTLNIGTVATSMPITSTATLEFASAANVDSGLRIYNGGNFIAQGAVKNTVKTLLTVDASASATSLTVVSTDGWAAGDVLWFASTSTTAAQSETKTILTVDSGTTLTLTAGLTNAHSGTPPTQGEIANITRNVKFTGVSATLQGFVDIQSIGVSVDCDYVEFTWLGSATALKRGIDCLTTTGNANFQYCAIHTFSAASSLGFFAGTNHNNIVFSNNVICSISASSFITSASSTGTNVTVENNLFIRNVANAATVSLGDGAIVFNNNTVAGGGGTGITTAAIILNEASQIWTFNNNISHSNAHSGLTIVGANAGGVLENFTAWRNLVAGISTNSGADVNNILTFENLTLFANATANIDFTGPAQGRFIINDGSIYGGSTAIGIRLNTTALGVNLEMNSTVLGSPSSHSTADISVLTSGHKLNGIFNNCLFGSSTELANQTNLSIVSVIGSSKHDQIKGNHKTFKRYGTIIGDTTIYRAATPSERLTPNNATEKLDSSIKKVAVNDTASVTISVWVRQSVDGDGTRYNGNRIRLIVRRNDSVGITPDDVLAIATVDSEGFWEQLTGVTDITTDDGVLDFYVDCDGTTGWINIDDWSIG